MKPVDQSHARSLTYRAQRQPAALELHFEKEATGEEWCASHKRAKPCAPCQKQAATMGEFPPGPADRDGWQRIVECAPWLAPAIAQSDLRRVAHGLALADRVDLLQLLGNGVVPQQAEHAYRILRGRLMAEGLWL